MDPQHRSEPTPAAVLLVSPFGQDHICLGHILHGSAWQLSCALTCRGGLSHVREHVIPVVICEHHMDDGAWTDMLEAASAAAQPPAVIVTSRHADERLWAEVLNLGGWDVLAKPFGNREVIHSVSAAWRQWDYRRRQAGAAGQSKVCTP